MIQCKLCDTSDKEIATMYFHETPRKDETIEIVKGSGASLGVSRPIDIVGKKYVVLHVRHLVAFDQSHIVRLTVLGS